MAKRLSINDLFAKVKEVNQHLGVNLVNYNFNGINHLQTMNSGRKIFAGSTRECYDFLNGLMEFEDYYKRGK